MATFKVKILYIIFGLFIFDFSEYLHMMNKYFPFCFSTFKVNLH